MADNAQIERMLQALSQRLDTPASDIRSALEGGSLEKLVSKMDKKQSDKIEAILSDEEKAKKLLSTPQAQAIMKKLMG
ncbi:MAG: hypothetical protein IJJ15_03205 [Ruminococcus sp.]|nr:hypothetical protein [Ruminococcus sp.]